MKYVLRLLGVGVAGGIGAVLSFPDWSRPQFDMPEAFTHDYHVDRADCMRRLKEHSSAEKAMDILVIGGGASGSGVALDAASRGMSVGLVEAEDYASGTSSKSTKLLHGGVRYLEKAVLHLDQDKFALVCEGLKERATVLHQAPHLCTVLPTIIPCYEPWEKPFYWAGMKFYDLVAAWNQGTVEFSHLMSAEEAKKVAPTIATERNGKPLKGAVVYYDGQMDDARLNVSVALTAAKYGAATVNYCKATALKPQATIGEMEDAGLRRPIEVHLRDELTRKDFKVYTHSVVNAAGPFSDAVSRLLDDQDTKHRVQGSVGVHVVLPEKYSAGQHAVILPKTADGRVVFIIPWQGKTLVGTTETPLKGNPSTMVAPTQQDVDYILDSVESYCKVPIPERDVLSAWAGIRPLAVPEGCASDPRFQRKLNHVLNLEYAILPGARHPSEPPVHDLQQKTGVSTSIRDSHSKDINREHIIDVDVSHGVVSVVGGKWTTYRKIASDVVNEALAHVPSLRAKYGSETHSPNVHVGDTENVLLVGGDLHEVEDHQAVIDELKHISHVQDDSVLQHLYRSYGTASKTLAAEYLHGDNSKAERNRHPIHPGFPYLEGEVRYAAKYEQAMQPADFLCRRSRLSFLDIKAAEEALPRVADILAEEHSWSGREKSDAVERTKATFGSFHISKSQLPAACREEGGDVAASNVVSSGKKAWWKFW